MTFFGFPAVSHIPRPPQYRLPVPGRLLVGRALAGRVDYPRPFLLRTDPASSAGSSLEDLLGLASKIGRPPRSVKLFFLERSPN